MLDARCSILVQPIKDGLGLVENRESNIEYRDWLLWLRFAPLAPASPDASRGSGEIADQKWPCTFLRIDIAEFAVTANSSRVNPQHNKLTLMAAPFPA